MFTLLAAALFYFEVSNHGRANINLDLDQTPLGSSSNPIPQADTDADLSNVLEDYEDSSSPHCKIGSLYGSCFNEVRFFQCTPDGPLAHPCPAGQKFFCTGEGEGECDSRHALRKGFEMVCEGEEELGECKKAK